MKTDIPSKQREELAWVNGLLVSAQKRDWYGTITIEVKRGRIHLVRAEQTLKPPTSPNSPNLSDFSS